MLSAGRPSGGRKGHGRFPAWICGELPLARLLDERAALVGGRCPLLWRVRLIQLYWRKPRQLAPLVDLSPTARQDRLEPCVAVQLVEPPGATAMN